MLKHLACIMDGNRRWAKAQGKPSFEGHRAGLTAAKRVIDYCIAHKIPYLSLYTFSLENFNRSPQELTFLFSLIVDQITDSLVKEFKEKGVSVRFVGNRSLFPEMVIPSCERIEKETEGLTNLHVNILFCYGGQQEIVEGVKQVIKKVQEGVLACDDITPQMFEHYLWTQNTPPPDLIIRTGGSQRLSNFLLYQAAYSELCFLDCMWPDVDIPLLDRAVNAFNTCQRNFGV